MAETKKPEETALARIPVENQLQFIPRTMDEAWEMATWFARSGMLPKHLIGKPSDILVTIAFGRELGLSPMQAIQDVYVVHGKPGVSADLAQALCISRPEVCLYFQMVESNERIATFETHRKGNPTPTRLSYTVEEAKAAGLFKNDVWSRFTARMLRNRAKSMLAKEVYPDLTKNVYDVDEVREIEMEQRGPAGVYTMAPPKPRPTAPLEPAPEAAHAASEDVVDAEMVDEPRPLEEREPGADDDGPPTEEDILAALAATKTPAEVEKLAADVKLYAKEDKSHPLRVAYNAAWKRTKAGAAS